MLSARQAPDGSPDYTAYARVDNFAAQNGTVSISAFADTVPLTARLLDIPTGGHADVTWQVPAGTAKLTVKIAPTDDLPADNQAILIFPTESENKVVLQVPNPDLYTRALDGIPGLAVVTGRRLSRRALPLLSLRASYPIRCRPAVSFS